jgi:KDO2-lipid IV(A) lauroyltransferase
MPTLTALSRDLRFGGTWTRGQTIKNDLVHALLRIAIASSPIFPGRLAGTMAYFAIGTLARRNVMSALGASPAEARRIARAAFENLGGHLADVLRALRGRPLASLPIAPEALRVLDEAMSERRGVVFASAHLGPWERVAATLVRNDIPLVTMARESYDPRITRMIDRLRDRTRVPSILRGSAGAATRIVRTLRSGAVLGMPMDLATRAPTVTVPFFNRPTATVIGPARIALRTGAPLVVGTAEKIDGELVVTATRIAHEPDPITLTALLNSEIERRIRTAPEEWLWMHPRW